MNPSKDISEHIIKCVQEAAQEVVSSQKSEFGDKSMSTASDLFMKHFQTNLATAINIIYFNENDQETESVEQPNKEKEEYEKAVLDVISKRRQGTKTCKDVLEKTLSLEKRTVLSREVAPGTVVVQKMGKQPAVCKKEELKLGAKKTVEYLRNSAKQVIELNDRTEELIKAAIIFKDANGVDLDNSRY